MEVQINESIGRRSTVVHLAYLDDSDTKAKVRKFQVMSAVIIEDKSFKLAEVGMSAQVENLMGADGMDKFQEFHAAELYGGYGAFEGIDQVKRFETIGYLLNVLSAMNITVIYGSVDLDQLKADFYGSADPVDICFRKCLTGIRKWADEKETTSVWNELAEKFPTEEFPSMEKFSEAMFPKMLGSLVMVVVDECDGGIKKTLQKSFRGLRPAMQLSITDCLHDDLYFGDSRYSLGIQLADLCSYFIAKHLEGDARTDDFYGILEPRIYHWEDDGKKSVIVESEKGA